MIFLLVFPYLARLKARQILSRQLKISEKRCYIGMFGRVKMPILQNRRLNSKLKLLQLGLHCAELRWMIPLRKASLYFENFLLQM